MDAINLPVIPENATLSSQLQKLSDDKPDKVAFTFVDVHMHRTVLTRKEVWDWSRRYARFLTRHGVKRGDAVCNCLINSPERLLTTYGTIVAGALSLHGQILLADGEDFLLNLRKSACTTILVDPSEKGGAVQILNKIQYVHQETGEIRFKGLPDLANIIYVTVMKDADLNDVSVDKRHAWLKTLPYEEDFYVDSSVKADDIANLFVSSGSTGYSKIIPQTHKSNLFDSRYIAFASGVVDENSKFFNDRSLGWSAGLSYVYPGIGCTRVLSDHRRGSPHDAPDHFFKLLTQERCDSAFTVSFEASILLDSIESHGGPCPFRFRQIACGGGPMVKRVMGKFGLFTDALAVIYGSTESMAISCTQPLKNSDEYEPFCVGKPFPVVETRVVDDQHRDVAIGQTGELVVRSFMVMAGGYYNDEEKTRQAFLPGGWFRTGDLAKANAKGQLYVYGRKSEAITRGTYIQYPGWMESRLIKCPGVKAAVLVGVPDERMFEEVCACIVPTPGHEPPTPEVLEAFCHAQFLSTKDRDVTPMPKYFLFFDQLPINSIGKVMRSELKKEAKRRLGL